MIKIQDLANLSRFLGREEELLKIGWHVDREPPASQEDEDRQIALDQERKQSRLERIKKANVKLDAVFKTLTEECIKH